MGYMSFKGIGSVGLIIGCVPMILYFFFWSSSVQKLDATFRFLVFPDPPTLALRSVSLQFRTHPPWHYVPFPCISRPAHPGTTFRFLLFPDPPALAPRSVSFYFQGCTDKTMREPRLVMLPEFQGFGLGPKLSNCVGGLLAQSGATITARTAHPRLGAYRESHREPCNRFRDVVTYFPDTFPYTLWI